MLFSFFITFTCHVFINGFIEPMFIEINDVPLIRGTFLNSILDRRISQIKILRVSSKRKISACDSTPCQNTTNETGKTFERTLSCLPYRFYEIERLVAAVDRNIRTFS